MFNSGIIGVKLNRMQKVKSMCKGGKGEIGLSPLPSNISDPV